MKKNFKNIDELHAEIEKRAKKTIKFYYTDYKNFDRPRLMKATGEKATIYIIFRESGSYLYTAEELKKYDFSRVVMEYYTNDKTAKYYKIDLEKLTLETIPAGLPAEYKKIYKAA